MSRPSNHPAAAFPTWLAAPKVPLTVVVGPPGNGARAWIEARAADDHLVLDLAAIIAEISGVAAHNAGPEWVAPALARRNDALAQLARLPRHAAAWAIAPCPESWQRAFWATRGATVMLLDPGREAALIGARAEAVREKFVHQWYAEAAADAAPSPAPPTDAARPSAAARGYGTGTRNSHRTLRDKQLLREPWCRFCLAERKVRVPATVLDHILPFKDAEGRFDGKRWGDPANHRSLCQPCHDSRGATRSRSEKPPGAGADGRPLDPNHPWRKPVAREV